MTKPWRKQQEAACGRGPGPTGKLAAPGGTAMFYAVQPNFLSACSSMPPISIHPLFSYQDYWARTWARPPLRSARSSAGFLQPSSSLFTWLKAPWSDGFYLTRRLRERNLGRVPPQRTSAAANQEQYRSCGGTRVCGRSDLGVPFLPGKTSGFISVLIPLCLPL